MVDKVRFTIILFLAALLGAACGTAGKSKDAVPAAAAPITPAQAAAKAAEDSEACKAAQPFYWEVGDGNGLLASGSAGSTQYQAGSVMAIASASKWIFGTYVLERYGGALDPVTAAALRMLSGYVGFKIAGCRNSVTVADCLADSGTAFKSFEAGKFDYDGGHFQKWSADNGLGAMNDATLATELHRFVGNDVAFDFTTPQLAGGIRSSAKAYAIFLRKLMAGSLRMGAALGKDAVCTLPAACATALSSPAPEAWHYSYGHWVEDDPKTGDGAFSSPGLFGFYPWISADKKTYGIVARQAISLTAYIDSAYCGREIRKAYLGAASAH